MTNVYTLQKGKAFSLMSVQTMTMFDTNQGMDPLPSYGPFKDSWYEPCIAPEQYFENNNLKDSKQNRNSFPNTNELDFGTVFDDLLALDDPLERAFFKELATSTKKEAPEKMEKASKPSGATKHSKSSKPQKTSKPSKPPSRKRRLPKDKKAESSHEKSLTKRRRRCNEWTEEDVVLLLNCTKLLANFELKTISEALFHCIKRNPGKCHGRAAEKKLKRLGIFENWKTADKKSVVQKIDKKLEEFGEIGRYLNPDLVEITNQIIKGTVTGSKDAVSPNSTATQKTQIALATQASKD